MKFISKIFVLSLIFFCSCSERSSFKPTLGEIMMANGRAYQATIGGVECE